MTGSEAAASLACAELAIDLSAIVANWRTLCALHPSGPVAGVVKGDGYGLGAAQVVPALYAAGCRHFFTADLHEAMAIRALVPAAMVAVLNGLLPGTEAIHAAHAIDPVLGSLDEIARWRAEAARRGAKLAALLHIDTGMRRLGLDQYELEALRHDHGLLDGIGLRYVMTHLVASEIAGDPGNEAQRARFAASCEGLPPAPRSLANSSGLFLGPAFGSDLARPGAALYGIDPTPGQEHLVRAPALRLPVRLRARVLQVRQVCKGESVGYNATWHATRPSRIATVGVGYADGWPRALSNRGRAIFDGLPVPLVGRVSMDLTTYDVTGTQVRAGDWLELIGPALPAEEVAQAAGTNAYEILTSLGPRYRRTYRA